MLVWLTGASRTVIEIFIPVLKDSAANFLDALAPIAVDVVRSLMDSPAVGEQKQRVAMERIKQIALAEGINASTHAINLTIELAYSQLKGGVDK